MRDKDLVKTFFIDTFVASLPIVLYYTMPSTSKTLEICVTTLADVRNAIDGGADRLELCSALATGGVTPSAGMISCAIGMARGAIPVNVLIRPREGDFVYSEHEMRVMLHDIMLCAKLGASGVVIGALTPDGHLDAHALRRMAAQARDAGLTVTLSRAIDRTPDPVEAVAAAIDCGCHRILTSGGLPTALEGAGTLTRMHRAACGRLLIMAGSGISEHNLTNLLATAEIDEVHGSFRGPELFGHDANALPGLDALMRHTSEQCVAEAKRILHQF